MTMRIDCDSCVVRGLACHDCVVTVLLGPPPELTIDDDERRALDVLAEGGLVPPLRLVQPGGSLQIAPGPACAETVVWNPGATLAAKLADLPDDGWRHMLCVEAACIDTPVLLAPGARWQAWQQLTVI
jgi:hypothetical protein